MKKLSDTFRAKIIIDTNIRRSIEPISYVI